MATKFKVKEGPKEVSLSNAGKDPSFEHVKGGTSRSCFDAVILGSGSSAGCPKMEHILQGRCKNAQGVCCHPAGGTICEEALRNSDSKNRRCNPSMLVRYETEVDGKKRKWHVMIDCGKTAREAAFRSLPKFGVQYIDAMLITHAHADAYMGLDDVRDFMGDCYVDMVNDSGETVGSTIQTCQPCNPEMPIYSNQATLDAVKKVFGYMVGEANYNEHGFLKSRVGKVRLEKVDDWDQRVLFEDKDKNIEGLPVKFFPVYHGGTYVSLCYAFGEKLDSHGKVVGHPLVYISDVKIVPPEAQEWLEGIAPAGIDILVLDALCRGKGIGSHMGLDESLDFIRKLKPKKTLLVGVDSCEMGEHDAVNAELRNNPTLQGLDVQLAFDGLHCGGFNSTERAAASGGYVA